MMDIKKTTYKFLGADERTRKMRCNTLVMFVVRTISIGISLLYVPLLLHTLEAPQYGVWLTLTSIVTWISLMDIGLGNGLRNKLVDSLAKNDLQRSRMYVSSAYAAMICIVAILIVVFLSVDQIIVWQRLLNIDTISENDLKQLVDVVIIAFCTQLILQLLTSILFAFQKPAVSSTITMLNNMLSFIAVFIVVKVFHESSLLRLGTIIALVPVLNLTIASIIFFVFSHPELRPSFKSVEVSSLQDILSIGVKFFVIQVITIILYQANNLLITHTVDPTSVVRYNIPHRYFNIMDMVFVIIVTPIWSATTDAYVRGDMSWIRNTNANITKIRRLVSLVGVLMLAVSPIAFNLWLGKGHIDISILTSVLIFIDFYFKMAYSSFGFFINGIGKIKAQLIITSIVAILYIPFAYFIGRMVGLNGILAASIIVNLINFIWSKYQFGLIVNKKARGIWDK